MVGEETGGKGIGYFNTGITLERARNAVKKVKGVGQTQTTNKDVSFSESVKSVFESSIELARHEKVRYVSPEHILIGLCNAGGEAMAGVLEQLSVDAEVLTREARVRLHKTGGKGKDATQKSQQTVSKTASGPAFLPRKGNKGTKTLDEFCRNLTEEARTGKIDPVIGRDSEVERIIQILARRSKNNPILLGDPGVGKTAVVEGLALRIAAATVPTFLEGQSIYSLDVGRLMAGAKERGELETRVTNIVRETIEAGNVILMIDEIHTVVGSGGSSRGGGGAAGGLDISNMLKPALARGAFQCIGATTLMEHRKYIECDPALERRFQSVMICEPTSEEAYNVLLGLKRRYERHHQCIFTEDAIQAAVELSSRYVADRQLPDKAIDLLDEAGSRACIAAFLSRKVLDEEGFVEEGKALWNELIQVQEAKDEAIECSLFEEAFLLHNSEEEIKSTFRNAAARGKPIASVVPTVSVSDIEAVCSAWTGIPVEKLSEDDVARLQTLDATLGSRVIGQEEAVTAICRAMQRAGCGLKDPNRPIAAMLFSGPTGVGKTELTKALASSFFGGEKSMVRLDMSEYMERHSVSKLVGAPPGYVGYGEGGKLTEAVRCRPFSVVLLDEVEKAHPDVFNILLQVLEDGRLTDSQGRVVSFKNTLVIMTSNVGSHVISKGGATLGFQAQTEEEDGGQYSRIRSLVMEELRGYFRPELLNRLDEVVVFRQLDRLHVRAIANLMLQDTANRLNEQGIGLCVSQAAMAKLVEEGYDKNYGARPMRRAVMQWVDDPISESVLNGEVLEGDIALLHVTEGQHVHVHVCGRSQDDLVCMSEMSDAAFTSVPEQSLDMFTRFGGPFEIVTGAAPQPISVRSDPC